MSAIEELRCLIRRQRATGVLVTSDNLHKIADNLETLLAALENRRVVEGWTKKEGCPARWIIMGSRAGKYVTIMLCEAGSKYEHEYIYSGQFTSEDACYAAAAEWVRGQG